MSVTSSDKRFRFPIVNFSKLCFYLITMIIDSVVILESLNYSCYYSQIIINFVKPYTVVEDKTCDDG